MQLQMSCNCKCHAIANAMQLQTSCNCKFYAIADACNSKVCEHFIALSHCFSLLALIHISLHTLTFTLILCGVYDDLVHAMHMMMTVPPQMLVYALPL